MLNSVKDISPYAPFLVALFEELEARNIRYCVLRSFAELPLRTYGDIDILVGKEGVRELTRIISHTQEDIVVIRKDRKKRHHLFYICAKSEVERAIGEGRRATQTLLDFQTELHWRGFKYLEENEVLSARERREDFFVPRVHHRVTHLFCHAMLTKGFFKNKYKTEITDAISQNGKRSIAPLSKFAGEKITDRLYNAFLTGEDEQVLRLRYQLIFSLLSRRPRQLLAFIFFHAREFIRKFLAVIFPPGILIVTAGPDGSGKTTIVERLEKTLSEGFSIRKIQYMGWKQFALPTKRLLNSLRRLLVRSGRLGADEGNGELTPRRGWTHNISVFHYYLDLWARYIVHIRPILARGGFVLCDRYFYDIVTGDAWICRNPKVRLFLLRLTPKPTMTILFRGDPEKITRRKEEASIEETSRQLSEYSSLKVLNHPIIELDTTNPLEENVKATVMFLFDQIQRESSL